MFLIVFLYYLILMFALKRYYRRSQMKKGIFYLVVFTFLNSLIYSNYGLSPYNTVYGNNSLSGNFTFPAGNIYFNNNSGKNKMSCFTGGVENYIRNFNGRLTGNIGSSFLGGMVSKTPEPGQFLRILIIYVRFPDDNINGGPMMGYAVWENSSMPRPLNPYTSDHAFIDSAEGSPDSNFTNRYREYTISDYFSEMSMGQLDVVGDEYYVTLPQTSEEYKANGENCANTNADAILLADELYNIDFSRYNNWTLFPDGWEWTPGAGDNVADMIVMVYRRAPGHPEQDWFFGIGVPASGISDLGAMPTLTLDGTTIYSNSGVTCLSLTQNYSKMTQVINHEMTHRYTYNHYEIGLMTGVEHCSHAYSPYERTLFEFDTAISVTYPYTEQSHVYTLDDYVFTGDLISIQLPETSENYYIANHQKKSVYDGITRGSNNCWNINAAQQDPYCPEGKGLYIYHHMYPDPCNNYKDMMLLQADGKYDWYVERMVPYFIPGYNFEIPLYERVKGNYLGLSEFHQPLDNFLPNMQEVNDKRCSDDPDDYFVTYDWLGDGKDAFNLKYDEILSPYSNPKTLTCNGGETGITVKLLSQDTITGAITIKVYYDNELALSELPPAKPKGFKVLKDIIEPVSGKFNPRLIWDKNIEPDFTGNASGRGFYNIYRGLSLTCSEDSLPGFTLIATISPDSTAYTDNEISLYPKGTGTGICDNLFRSISYRIQAVDNSGLPSVRSDNEFVNGYILPCNDSSLTGIHNNQIPVKYSVFNYPNPFNPKTTIKFSLPKSENVDLKIYSITGELVYNALNNVFTPAGYYSISFDGSNLSSGVYFYTIKAGSYYESKKMVLIK